MICFFFDIIITISLIPASIHSYIMYSTLGLPLIGKSSLAKTLVSGNNLVPNPASGIIACFIIKNFLTIDLNYHK